MPVNVGTVQKEIIISTVCQYFKIQLVLEKGDYQAYYSWGTVMSLPFKILYRGNGRVWPADEVQSDRTSDPVEENMELNMDG